MEYGLWSNTWCETMHTGDALLLAVSEGLTMQVSPAMLRELHRAVMASRAVLPLRIRSESTFIYNVTKEDGFIQPC